MPDSSVHAPYNIEAEQALLGALLLNNEVVGKLPAGFSGSMFYEPVHERIYDIATLDAVCDSLVAQVENTLSQLETDLEDGELGKRGLRTREKEAQELDDLVGTYEGILGKTLTSLRDRAEEVESAASIAILEAMADF